ncbi:MAG: aminoacyl-tRNA hydrolase [bacterium]
MKLIVGLGNPGNEHSSARHNAGWIILDNLFPGLDYQKFTDKSLVAKVKLGNENGMTLKPQTYMNESGQSVVEVMNFYKIKKEDIVVLHDDVDLPLGTIRTTDNSSSAGHKGVQDIIEALGTQEFKRIRIGIGRPIDNTATEDFVLQSFSQAELEELEKLSPQIQEALTKITQG